MKTMQKIICRTNIDRYHGNMFPELSYVPRKGEYVEVMEKFIPALQNTSKKFPIRLEVVSVTYGEKYIVVELWYNTTDLESYKLAGYKLF